MNARLKIENLYPESKYKPDYYFKNWLTLEDGGSDKWLYVCRDSLAYIFIEIIDLPAYCGRDADALFQASVNVVNLLEASPKTISDALSSHGFEEELDFKKESDRLQIACMMNSYGNHAPMWNESGGKVKDIHDRPSEGHPAFRILRANARKYAEKHLFNDEIRNELMNSKVVNAIGQTAVEFANGVDGLWSCLRRIQDNDNATLEQKMVLGAYQVSKMTLGSGPVPKDIINEKDFSKQ